MAILMHFVKPLNINKHTKQKSGVTDEENPKRKELIKIKYINKKIKK